MSDLSRIFKSLNALGCHGQINQIVSALLKIFRKAAGTTLLNRKNGLAVVLTVLALFLENVLNYLMCLSR